MKILLHDYSGKSAQFQIGRQLARRGHDVLYLHAAFTGPKASLGRKPTDPASFRVSEIKMKTRFQKDKYVRRQLQEIAYGKHLTARVRDFRPDLVICSDTPLFPLNNIRLYCRRARIPFVLWMMEMRGPIIRAWLNQKFSITGRLLGSCFVAFERWIVHHCDHVILISDDFLSVISSCKMPADRIDVLPLWSPLEDIRVVPKDNSWSRSHGLDRTTNLMYSGSLNHAHSPGILADLAQGLADRKEVRVVVVSEGSAVSYLAQRKAAQSLDNLVILPFQPHATMSEVLGAADALLTLLDADMQNYVAPGKVLSHFCAGRAQLAIMHSDNSSARRVLESGGGLVVPPNAGEVVAAALRLVDDKREAERMGHAGRAYAEQHFDIQKISDAFESMIMTPFNRKMAARPQ